MLKVSGSHLLWATCNFHHSSVSDFSQAVVSGGFQHWLQLAQHSDTSFLQSWEEPALLRGGEGGQALANVDILMWHWREKWKLDGNNWQWTRWTAWRGRRCQGSQKRRERLLGRAICQCQFTVSTNYWCGGSAVIKHPANPQIVSQAKKSIKVGVITTLTRWSIKAHRRAFEYHFIFCGKNFALSFYNFVITPYKSF